MSRRSFGVSFRSEVVVPVAPGSKERRKLGSASAEFRVPDDAKVSCQKADLCRSPSRRDPAGFKAWVCGSNFSHNDRLGCCVAYRRLHYGLREGVSGNRRFQK